MTGAGHRYTPDSADADIVIVNTCAFIEPAVQESVDTVLDYRGDNSEAFIVVAGCLPLRYGESLEEALTEADLFISPDQIDQLPEILRTCIADLEEDSDIPLESPQRKTGARVLTTPGYAYLRIAEGCSRRCRYCTIPSIRGPLRSVDADHLLGETQNLASQGVRELILVAQDLTTYGVDRREKGALIGLLDRIGRIEEIRWIRLMYLHPDGIPGGLARTINESDRVLPYLDVPIQHISTKVLKAMGRPWKADRIRKLFDRLRDQIDGLVLRTTLMVGYPAEGDREYRELRDFVESYEIEHVGVFTYSPEEGTSAYELGDPIPESVKQERANELREIYLRQATKRNRLRIGTVESCIVEGVSTETNLLLAGRTWDQAPEVDGVLYVTAGSAEAGEIREVLVTGAHGPDLFGELCA